MHGSEVGIVVAMRVLLDILGCSNGIPRICFEDVLQCRASQEVSGPWVSVSMNLAVR